MVQFSCAGEYTVSRLFGRGYSIPAAGRGLITMHALRLVLFVVLTCTFASPVLAQRYSAARDGDIVRLTDRTSDIVVSILPSVGNIAFEMRVHGHNVLRFPQKTIADFKAQPNATGIPFMGPWANRLDEQAFYANGRRYPFDMSLGNVRGNIPIHGFLTTTESGTSATASGSASATLQALVPPSIAAAFAPASVQVNANSVLTFTLTNPNPAVALSAVSFSDNLPANLFNANPAVPAVVNTCGGSLTASPCR